MPPHNSRIWNNGAPKSFDVATGEASGEFRVRIGVWIRHWQQRSWWDDPVPRPAKIPLSAMDQRPGLRHARQRIDPAQPAPQMRIVEDARPVELHADVVDRIMAVERWEQSQIGFGKIVTDQKGATV